MTAGCPLRLAVLAVFLAGAQPALAAPAGGAGAPLRTHNVVLIVSDGLRWQEVFTGADPLLLNEKNGGIWDKESDLRREFWRDSPQERRRALFPFLWSTLAARGQILGNQEKGSVVHVTNGQDFSYPGYNEMLTGHPDRRIDSNEFGPNPNVSVLEWLNGLPGLHGRVSVYATWEAFRNILNVQRSRLPLHVGWDPPYHGRLTPRQEMLNRLYSTATRFESDSSSDSLMQAALIDSLRDSHPRVLFVGYGETDDWAHAGRYDMVLHAAHNFDRFVAELWNTMQALPQYRDRTTFLLTADHGRGSGPVDWKEHGVQQPGSENIWLAVIGPDTRPLGEVSRTRTIDQAQIAATVAALLGEAPGFRKAVPEAAAPVAELLDAGTAR
ncbi:MAG: alkaline phosphatase family protein [Proteobacteria bacterium]|nr:alkaline phosphatase family protein [Pseudomonadota bacterium]